MVWAKVDDRLHASVKWRSSSKGARALWTTALSWCADQETDGFVPAGMLAVLDGTANDARSLVSAGLWESVEGGYVFRKWSEYQPSRNDLEQRRADDAERKRKAREAKSRLRNGAVREESEGSPDGHDEESGRSPLYPDPTRPDPTLSSSNEEERKPRGSRGTRVPVDFVITEELREWAAIEVPHVDVDKKLGEWMDFWKGVPGRGGVKLDWRATWKNGMRKQEDFALRDIARFGAPAAGSAQKAVF